MSSAWRGRLAVGVMIGGAAWLGAGWSAQAADGERLRVPLLRNAPVIDGAVNEAEWQGAARLEGFLDIAHEGRLDPRCGETLLGYDKDNLYLAFSSELPPDGKLVATVKNMGGQTINDDSVEVWLDPFRTERLKGEKNHPYCQFIGNSLGFFSEKQLIPGTVPNGGWTGKWNFKNGIDKGRNRWDVELSVSWKDLGVPQGTEMNGREIGLLLSRNWKRPWDQATCFNAKAFDNPLGYAAIKLDSAAPTIRMRLGEVLKGKFSPEITIVNNSEKPADYIVEARATHSDMPDKIYTETRSAAPNGTATFCVRESGDGFHPDATHVVAFTISSKDGEELFLSRTLSWKYPVSAPYPWKIAGASQDAGLMIAYHPSFNKLRVQADVESALGSQTVDALHVELRDAGGKQITAAKFELKDKTGEFSLDIPDVNDGTYTVKADFVAAGKSLKTVTKSFERQHFPWEGNKLGMSDKVYPPFVPLKVTDATVSMVMRDYALSKLGFPERIVAKGNEILAGGGMELGYVDAAGATRAFEGAAGKFLKTSDAVVVYEGRATAADLGVTVLSRIEYDGCAKVELEVAPTKGEAAVREFYLDIPLKSEIAVLHHACQASLRSNPAGALPAGEGIVWDSTKIGHGPILGSFIPYVWLGREEEGVAWFADNDRGWILDDKAPCLKVIRQGERTTLRVSFINKETKLATARKIVFGWQASPTKPMPEDWRKPTKGIPMHGGSNRYWGIRSSFAGKYPDGHDYRFADQLLIARKRKVGDAEFLKNWYQEHYGDVTDKVLSGSIKAHISGGMAKAVDAGRKENGTLMLYLEEHSQDQCSPEWRTFQDEWGYKDFTSREWLKKIMSDDESCSGVGITPVKSYQDFVMWESIEWLRRGIGIYCDNTFLRQSANTCMTAAYKRDDGNVQISSGFWDMRDYHKRMWVLTQECQPLSEYPLLISLHMTNTQLIPINTWDDVNLDIEWQWDGGNKPFPPDLLRAESLGRQTGSYPHALHQVTAKNWYFMDQKDKNAAPIPNPSAVRHEWGIRMVHEILQNLWSVDATEYPLEKLVRGFGYGEADCTVYNYWDKAYPVSVNSDGVKTIAMERGGKLLVVLTSWSEEPCAATLELTGSLRKFKGTPAVDLETGKECAVTEGRVTIPLDKYGVAIVSWGAK